MDHQFALSLHVSLRDCAQLRYGVMALTGTDSSIPFHQLFGVTSLMIDQSVSRNGCRAACAKSDNILTTLSPCNPMMGRLSPHKADGSKDFIHIRVFAVTLAQDSACPIE